MGTDDGLLWICSYSRADGPGPDPGLLSVWDGSQRVAALELFPAPSYGEFSADGGLLYLVGEGLPGSVVTVDTAALLAGAGPAAVLDTRWSGGDEACQLSLSPSGRQLAVANYCTAATPAAGGVVSVFTLTDGLPDGPARRLELSGSGPVPGRQPGPHAHQVTWIGEDELLVVDLGDDSLVAVAVGPDGEPTVTGRAAVVPGSGPRHLVQVPGAGLVLDEELSGQVSWWEPDEGGLLVQRARIGVLSELAAESAEAAGTPCDPSGIKLSADHHRAYIAVRGVDVISTVAIDPDGVEPLRLLATTPTGGAWPRDLLVDADTLWVANQGSSTVTGLAIDPTTGIPGAVHTTLDVPFPTWLARTRS